jgi:Family of unknown function (DUF6308)
MIATLQGDPWPDLSLKVAVPRVRRYFDPNGRYTGRWFDLLGRDHLGEEESPDRFTAMDIVAVSMLSVQIPPRASIELLDGQSPNLSDLLKKVPNGIPLWEAKPKDIDDTHSTAAKLWKALKQVKGVGWVTANKLLARKRPLLLPVYDSIVKARIQPRSESLWVPLQNDLLRDNCAMVRRLEEIHCQASVDKRVSLLRVFDVAMWMTSQRH